MSKTENKANKSLFHSLKCKCIRLRRILAFLVLFCEDRCRVATLFSNTHLFFENEPEKIREYAAVKQDLEWWWHTRNAVKEFIKKNVAKW